MMVQASSGPFVSTAAQPPDVAPIRTPPTAMRGGQWVLGLAAALGGWACGQWLDGPISAALATLCGMAVTLLLMRTVASGPAVETSPDPRSAGTTGAAAPTEPTRLQRSVVPVWNRQITAARAHADRSADQLLTSFSRILEQLERTLSDHASDHPLLTDIDAELQTHDAELQQLLATSLKAVAAKDHVVATLLQTEAALQQMNTLARQVQTISRATHLLALNASVEATRGGSAGGGFAVVAKEVRSLAAQSRDAGRELGRHINTTVECIASLRREVRRDDTEEDEILRQSREAATAVLRSLLRSTQRSGHTARALEDNGRSMRQELEQILISLQSQDRFSQMLNAVTDDMQRLCAWLEGADDPAAHSAARWLERLAEQYTMEDQHTSHHAMVKVDKAPSVEFF